MQSFHPDPLSGVQPPPLEQNTTSQSICDNATVLYCNVRDDSFEMYDLVLSMSRCEINALELVRG